MLRGDISTSLIQGIDFTLYIFIYFEEENIDNDDDGTMTILRIS